MLNHDRRASASTLVRRVAAVGVAAFTVLPLFSPGMVGAQQTPSTLPPLTLTLPTLFPADPNQPNTTLPPIVLPLPDLESVITTAPPPTTAAPAAKAAQATTGTTFRRSSVVHSPRPSTIPQRHGPASRPVTTVPAEDGGTGNLPDRGFDGSLPFEDQPTVNAPSTRELGAEESASDRVRRLASVAAGLLILVIVGMVGWLLLQARPGQPLRA